MLKQPSFCYSQPPTLLKEALANVFLSTTLGLSFMVTSVAATRSSTSYAYLITKILGTVTLTTYISPCFGYIKVTGDSLLIHEFAYSLFIGLCSVTSDMTGCSHSYHSITFHSIKLIHCGAPQRDVLSDKMVL